MPAVEALSSITPGIAPMLDALVAARQRSACAFASPCQITLTWPMVTSTGSPRHTLSATSASTP